MWLSQPSCGGRRLLDNRAALRDARPPLLPARPILHEPGPVDTRYFLSRSGVTVRAGETARRARGSTTPMCPRTGDGDHARLRRPRPRVTSTMPGAARRRDPPDQAGAHTPGIRRACTSRSTVSTNRDGRSRSRIRRGRWWRSAPIRRLKSATRGSAPRRSTLPGPTTVTWRFSRRRHPQRPIGVRAPADRYTDTQARRARDDAVPPLPDATRSSARDTP